MTGRAGQAELQGVGHLDPSPIVAEHGRQPPADAPPVELHVGIGSERCEHLVVLVAHQPPEVDLVVVAEEGRPLAGVGQRGGLGQRLQDRSDLVAGEGEERPLVEDEVEQHRETVTVTEVLDELFGLDVGLGEDDRIAPSPGELVVQVVQPGEVLARGGVVGHGELDDEGGGVEPEPRHAELQPEPDDLLDLLTHPGVVHVQVGLEVVEAVVVPRPGDVVERPRRVLIAGEHHALAQVARLLLRPDVPVPIRRGRVGASRLEPRVLVGGVVDDQIDEDADAPVVGLVDQLDEVAERAQVRGGPRRSR